MSKRDGIQVAVGGPGGLRGSVYEIWFGPADIYIANGGAYTDWKATIHYERPSKPGRMRYIGSTTAYAKKRGLNTSRKARARSEWSGMDLQPGADVTLEFRLRIPTSELRRLGTANLKPLNAGDPLHIRWLPAPPPGYASEVSIISGPPTFVGPRPRREDFQDKLVFEKQLANGRFVWIVYHHIPAPPSAELRWYRKMAVRKGGRRKDYRIVASMDCGDGSSAFVEFAAHRDARPPAASPQIAANDPEFGRLRRYASSLRKIIARLWNFGLSKVAQIRRC